MSSSPEPERRGYLDLAGGREVVYCHKCRKDWYNDEFGLRCPHCEGESCEIVTPEDDPRDPAGPPPSDPFDFEDPGEEMINDVFPSPPYSSPPDPDRGGHRGRSPIDPSSEQEIFTRFQETLNMLMGGPMGHGARSPREAFLSGPSTQTRTYVTPSGRATFSITTSTGPGLRGLDHSHDEEFDIIFSNAMGGGNIRPPNVGHPGLEGGLQGLFSLLLGPGLGAHNAVHGDAVYSQEALDRIITQLMENNPQSNAAPPATEAAIERLEKKRLDDEMMGESGKAECTICIDEMHVGDEVTVLPCKHWFHEECVVLWLKEHNTCPICRTPIEKREGNGSGNGNGEAGGSPGQQRRRGSENEHFSGSYTFADVLGGGGNRWSPGAAGGAFGGGAHEARGHRGSEARGPRTPEGRGPRSPEECERRLNAIRNAAGSPTCGQPRPERSRYRRDSWSPTSPPQGSSSARDRSPVRARSHRADSATWSSPRSGRSSHTPGGGSGGGSSNPLSWIRDRFGSSGSSHNGDEGRKRS